MAQILDRILTFLKNDASPRSQQQQQHRQPRNPRARRASAPSNLSKCHFLVKIPLGVAKLQVYHDSVTVMHINGNTNNMKHVTGASRKLISCWHDIWQCHQCFPFSGSKPNGHVSNNDYRPDPTGGRGGGADRIRTENSSRGSNGLHR